MDPKTAEGQVETYITQSVVFARIYKQLTALHLGEQMELNMDKKKKKTPP